MPHRSFMQPRLIILGIMDWSYPRGVLTSRTSQGWDGLYPCCPLWLTVATCCCQVLEMWLGCCRTWLLHFNFSEIVSWSQIKVYLFVVSFPCGSAGKESACNVGALGSVPGAGRSLEKGIATHSSILVWKIPWTEEPGGLQSMGSQKVGHDWVTLYQKSEL